MNRVQRSRPVITSEESGNPLTLTLREVKLAGHFYEGSCFEIQGEEYKDWAVVQYVQCGPGRFALICLESGNRVWSKETSTVINYTLVPVKIEMSYTRVEP